MFSIRKTLSGAAILAVMSAAPMVAQTQQMDQAASQSQEKIDVSDAELGKFATAFKQIQLMSQQANQKMAKTVTDEGLEVQRFNEIHKASLDPNKESDATPEEEKKHQAILSKLDTMQKDFETKVKKIIENQDMKVERYQQIAAALQTDTELQQRLQKSLQG